MKLGILLFLLAITNHFPLEDRYASVLAKINKGETAAAESELIRIIEKSPADATAWFYLGTIYATRGDYLTALIHYREAARLEPSVARYQLALAYVYRDITRYDEAIAALRRAIAADPKEASAYFALGAIYHRQEKDESAKKELEKGLQLDPESTEARLLLADIFLITSGVTKARELYAQVVLREPKNRRAHLGLASIAALNPETYTEAIEHLQRLLSFEPESFEAQLQLGQIYVKMNRSQEAIRCLRAAVALDPSSTTAHLALGRLLVQTGLQQEGERHLARFKELTAKEDTGKKASRTVADLLREGKELAWQNRLREAIAKLDHLLEIKPDFAPAHAMLGKIYLSMRDVARARGHIAQALNLNRVDPECHYLFGLVLKEEKQYVEAIDALQRAVAAKPDFADARNILGNLHSELGRHAEAVPHYLEAIALEPNEPEPHLNLANAYKRLGKKEEAEKELATYRKLAGTPK